MNDTRPSLRPGDSVVVTAERALLEGRSVAHHEGLTVFIDGAVPGDTVRASVYRRKKQYAEARLDEVLDPSPHRIPPRCDHFGICGGCTWQHMAYAQQLEWKRAQVVDAFERIGGFAAPDVAPALAAPEPFFYRNKMEYSFGDKRWLLPEELGTATREEPFVIGLHVPGRFDRILHIDACHLQSPESNAILNATRGFFLSHGLRPYSTKTHTGDLRHLVIREGKRTGERMVFLVTSGENQPLVREWARMIRDGGHGVTTIVHGITARKSAVAAAEVEDVLHGDGVIRERIGDILFTVSPTSFFQTNTRQAERLYETAVHAADLRPSDRVWDLYCGTGTIALYLSHAVAHVLGIEMHEPSVRNARENARTNGVTTAEFECADVLAFARRAAEGAAAAPDVAVVDPPRAGLHADAVRAIASIGVRRLVYVSCNPATCARDCAQLAADGYRIEGITPVDMFPQTSHVECVVRLRRE